MQNYSIYKILGFLTVKFLFLAQQLNGVNTFH